MIENVDGLELFHLNQIIISIYMYILENELGKELEQEQDAS